MELLCIAFAVLAILFLTLVGVVHLLGVMSRAFGYKPQVHEVTRADREQFRPRPASTHPSELHDLQATLRHLVDFQDRGLIDQATFERLHHHISVRQKRLRGVPVQSKPAPAEAILTVLPAEKERPAPPVLRAAAAEAPAAPALPPPPRKSWGELLASFMEERHILWGELIGGLLIVGCSVALVLSLWQTLEQIPMFPFVILAALTSALFGVGRYTLRRWKLEATSRGLLVIALLLVPLNFVVLAGLSARTTDILIELTTKLVATPLFVLLVFRAGSLLFSRFEAALLALGLVGAAVSPLPMPRLFEPQNSWWLLPAIWAVACYGTSIGLFLRRRWNQFEMESRPAWETLGFAGLATFAAAIALGFIGIWAGTHGADLPTVMHRLALPIVLAGAPLAATGLFVQRRCPGGLPMVAGTAVAMIGMLVHGEALLTSWPEPVGLTLVGLIIAAAWTAAAIAFRLPLAHVAALIGLTSAVLAVVHVSEPLTWRLLLSSESAIGLGGLAVALAIVADDLRCRDLWDHGKIHATFAGGVIFCALLLAVREAGTFPWRMAGLSAVAMIACLILERRWAMPPLGQIGAILAPVTTMPLLHALLPGQQAIWATLLAAEAVGLCLIRPARRPAIGLAVGLALICAIALARFDAGWHALTLGLLALVAILQAHQLRVQVLASIASGLLLLSLGHAIYVQPKSPIPLAGPLVFLIHATVLMPALFLRRFPALRFIGMPLADSAKVGTLVAVISLGLNFDPARLTWLTAGAGWLAALWLIFALVESEAGWYTASQAAAAMTAILGVAAALRQTGHGSEILNSLDLFALALTGLVLGWTVLRIRVRHPIWDNAAWPAFERVLLGAMIGVMVILAAIQIAPGVAAEFGGIGEAPPSVLHFWRIPGGQWIVLLALTATLVVEFWAIQRTWQHTLALVGLLGVYLTIPTLAASYFDDQLATASVLRWGLGIACLLGCVPFWFRESLAAAVERLGIRTSDSWNWQSIGAVRGLRFALLAIAGGVPLLITLFTMSSLIAGYSLAGPAIGTYFQQMGFTWSHGIPLTLVAAGIVGHALRDRSAGYAFAAGLLVKFLVCGGFLVSVSTAHRPFDDTVLIELGQRFAITAGVWAIAWLYASRYLRRPDKIDGAWVHQPSIWWDIQFGLAAISAALPVVAAGSWIMSTLDLPWHIAKIGSWPTWSALALVLLTAERRARFAGKELTALIIGVGAMFAVVLAATLVPAEYRGWAFRALMLGWAGCAVLWSALTHWKASAWLRHGLATAIALTILLALKDLFIHDYSDWLLRMTAPLAIAVTALAAALFESEQERLRKLLASAGLSLAVAALAALGIALVPPDAAALWLHRSVALLTALSLATIGYAIAGRRLGGRWGAAASELAPNLGLMAAGLTVINVIQQGFVFNPQTMRTPLHGAEVGLLVLATIGLMAAAILFVVRPEVDPFRTPDRWREGYVYASEVLLVLMFLHLRFNVPGMFPKIEAQAWAFVIMAIAFIGVGLSELLRVLRLETFVRPLQRTGLFLPLLPLLMFWMKPPPSLREPIISVFPGSKPLLGFFDQIPTDYANYSILWFLFGLLYAGLAISRQSFRHALFAALAANVGIWSLLWHAKIPLAAHPQLWLVPLALIILVSEQYQHRHIRPELSIGLRYTGLGLLYLSSTTDFFLAGLGNSVILPLALALLSIAGVLIGILLRIRSYLFLGTAFLALVVFSMIWHAAVDLSQTWLWWASGILLGVAILTLFALFEKRRQSVVHAIEELRGWR